MARFTQLRIYHLALEILQITHQELPKFRGYAELRDQMKRSSISVVSNICEGSERTSKREFHYFLNIARASNAELEGQWHIAIAVGFISKDVANETLDKIDHLGRMLTRFMISLKHNE